MTKAYNLEPTNDGTASTSGRAVLSYARQLTGSNVMIARSGPWLVTVRDIVLPNNCVKCNEPGVRQYRRRVIWHERWIYLLLLPGVFIYVIVALVLRKSANYTCSLCEQHARKRRNLFLIVWGIVVTAVVVVAGGIFLSSQVAGSDKGLYIVNAVLIALGLLFIACVMGVIIAPILRAKKIDQTHATYTGCCPAFLDELPSV